MSDSKRGELILLMLYRSQTHAQGEEASVRACLRVQCVCVCEIKTQCGQASGTDAHTLHKTGWKG